MEASAIRGGGGGGVVGIFGEVEENHDICTHIS